MLFRSVARAPLLGGGHRQSPASGGGRPQAGGEYVYLRDNPRGPYEEHWHHSNGCHRWLVVTRNTQTHEQIAVRDVREGGA